MALAPSLAEIEANLTAATQLAVVTASKLVEIQDSYETVKTNLDHFFLCVMGAIICFMQCGFAFLECGAVRIRNATNILFKNAMDSFVGGLMYWACGYAFAFGEKANSFLGYYNFFAIGLSSSSFAWLFFQFSFAATATTIVSGAVAERMEMGAYLVTAAVLTGFVYPVVSHWTWDSGGWLATRGFQDFAGSAVVHMCGGSCAFIGAAILGPRYMRFTKGMEDVFRGHSVPHVALGAFIIFFGFLAFNGGSVGNITGAGSGPTMALAMLTTLISGATSALCTLIIHRHYSVNLAVNGAIAGMVAACGGCNVFYTYVGCICGALAAVVYNGVSWINKTIKVDDPLDAVAVHFGGGLVGIVLVPFFDKDKGLFYGPDKKVAAKILIWNMVGVLAIIGWCCAFCVVMFGTMRLLNLLRVDRHYETHGMDERKHKEPAYPDVINLYNHVHPGAESPFDLRVSSSEPDLVTPPPAAPLWKAGSNHPKTNNWTRNQPIYQGSKPRPRPRGEPVNHPYMPEEAPRAPNRRRYHTRLQSADYPNHQEHIPEFRQRGPPHPRY